MVPMDYVLPSLEQMCWEAVDALLGRHDWRLLERAEFAQHALSHLRSGVARDARRAATFAYSHTLYTACSGAEGLDRQNRAYTELFQYLFESALRRYADLAEEVSQRAIANIFTNFQRCREPGAFLAFALQHLLDAARALRREQALPAHTPPGRTFARALGEQVADQRQPDPAEALIAGELQTQFEQLAKEFLLRHPRAARQFAALRLKYIDNLDDTTIAAQLGVPVRSVYVLRARAIEKLRAEPAWRALASEFGIFNEREQRTESREQRRRRT